MKPMTLFLGVLLSSVILSAQQHPQDAMQAAIERLEQAQKAADQKEEANALCDVAAADLMACLDAEAEDYASRAEKMAREKQYHDVLSHALIIKSNLCAYAETDSLFNRNDEGVVYAEEALKEAELSGSEELTMEACLSLSQLYVNKNRWNNPLNKEWYALSGQYLDRAEQLANMATPAYKVKFLACRMRHFRQGNQINKAIEYCETAFCLCGDEDWLMKAQLCDHLTPLYILAGRYEDAAQTHSSYVHFSTMNSRSNEAANIQEIQGKYELKLKQSQIEKKTYQILLLSSLAILLLAAAVFLYIRHSKEKALRLSVQQDSLLKEELIEFISKDLKNPWNSGKKEFEDFAANAAKMTEEQIAAETKKLLEEGRHLSREVAEYVSDIIIKRKKVLSNFGLTEREIDIIKLSIQGLSASEIADKLCISSRTVSNHKASIYSKLGVKSNAEMCRIAQDAGII